MAVVDKYLYNSFAGILAPEECKQKNINTVTQIHEIFQVRLLSYLIEQECIKNKISTISMIELGADDGEYTHIFRKVVSLFDKKSFNICTDAMLDRVKDLKDRFKDKNVEVYHGYSGSRSEEYRSSDDIPEGFFNAEKITVRELFTKNNLDYLNFLHVDIQGGEEDLITEIINDNLYNKIGYYFISTHGADKHLRVLRALKNNGHVVFDIIEPGVGWAFGDGFILATNKKISLSPRDIPLEYMNFNTKFNDPPIIPGCIRFTI
tara:strand:- start:129 stop:917 length:789 start_codon:yes stop_codon:yes gene_type:complete